MSKTRLISALAAGLGILAAACWFVTGTFPLVAAPQVVNDGPGVVVDMGGATVMHRTSVAYPESARRLGVQGTVTLEVKLDSAGNVSDTHVLAGPEELRKTALQAVLQWHFTRDSAGATRQVNIAFQLPNGDGKGVVGGVPGGVQQGVIGGVVSGGVIGGVIGAVPRKGQNSATIVTVSPRAETNFTRVLKGITVVGLPDGARNELLSRLPVHEGDTLTPEAVAKTDQAVREFDEHLSVQVLGNPTGDAVMLIRAPGAMQVLPPAPTVGPEPGKPGTLRVGGNVQAASLVSKVAPVYPPLAKQAAIQGVVRLEATIAEDGTVESLKVIEGHPLLIQSAMDAVRQWTYKQTLLNGNPVKVVTTVDVNYTLSQ